jgi:hypothetical protein
VQRWSTCLDQVLSKSNPMSRACFWKKVKLRNRNWGWTRPRRHYGSGAQRQERCVWLNRFQCLSMSELTVSSDMDKHTPYDWLIFSPYALHWRLWRDVMSTYFEVLPVRCSETRCHQAPGVRTPVVETISSRWLVPQHTRR